MSYNRGHDRSETRLLPPCVDDYVRENAPVRFVDFFVERLDFQALGFTHAEPKATGRPPYHPADLLKLYLWGYLNRIRSSRGLEEEATRNLEVIWLLREVRPDFKTIADFRKDNRRVFKFVLKEFNQLCQKMNLFGAKLTAVDGSKFKAVNNSRRHLSEEALKEKIKQVEAEIDRYLDDSDDEASSEEDPGAPTTQELKEKIKQLQEDREWHDQLLQKLQSSGEKEVSLTDADCRKMKGAHGEHFMGYNVQVAVDAKHHLIVAEEVVQSASDRGQLGAMAVAAKEELEVEELQVVADSGYHEAGQLEVCEENGVEAIVPEQGKTSGQGKGGQKVFPKEQFVYDAQTDAYHCPGNQTLPFRKTQLDKGKERKIYYDAKCCRKCELKAQCTTGRYRVIGRLINEEVVERAAKRAARWKDVIVRRKAIVEHVFGSLRGWHHDRFLMKGLEKVRGEFSLSALAYNLRRAMNLVDWQELIAATQKQAV